MGKFFDYDNPIMSTINKVFDCILLGLIWMVFCIPVITFGAATTAFYYTVNKVIRHGRSHIWQEFWSSFKSNFKQSTVIYSIMLVLLLISGMDYYLVRAVLATQWGIPQEIAMIFIGFINILLVWAVYLLTYVARFVCSTKKAFKNTFLIMVLNWLWSVLIWVLLVATVAGLLFILAYIPILIFIFPTAMMLLFNLVLEHIFKKYMSPEDLEKEAELNGKQDNHIYG